MPALGIPPPSTWMLRHCHLNLWAAISGQLPAGSNTRNSVEDVAFDFTILSSLPRQSLESRPPLFPATPRDTAQMFSPHYHPTFRLLSLCG